MAMRFIYFQWRGPACFDVIEHPQARIVHHCPLRGRAHIGQDRRNNGESCNDSARHSRDAFLPGKRLKPMSMS